MGATSRKGPPRPRTYGPVQLAERLGLTRWQVDRAVSAGIIPPPDVAGQWRWSEEVAARLSRRRARLAARIGSIPDYGATSAADVLRELLGEDLAERLGPITPGTIRELHVLGKLPVTGDWKGWPIYCGRALERLAARAVAGNATAAELVARAARDGHEWTTDQAAGRLGARRVDVEHLVRAGLLAASGWSYSGHRPKRYGPDVALYNRRSLDQAAERAAAQLGITWAHVQDTPARRPSPLAALPTPDREAR